MSSNKSSPNSNRSVIGTKTHQFKPRVDTQSGCVHHYQNICSLPEFIDKSPEELRFEDLYGVSSTTNVVVVIDEENRNNEVKEKDKNENVINLRDRFNDINNNKNITPTNIRLESTEENKKEKEKEKKGMDLGTKEYIFLPAVEKKNTGMSYYQHICYLNKFSDKSPEELRFEDMFGKYSDEVGLIIEKNNTDNVSKSPEGLKQPDWWISRKPIDKISNINVHSLAKRAVKEFYATVDPNKYQVMDVFVIQNLHVWHQHQNLEITWLTTRRLTPSSTNVCHLWHGSGSEIIPEICNKGFLRDFNQTAMYGKGVYFARDAIYPTTRGYAKFDDPQGCAHLLYCRVICGDSAPGTKDLTRPPNKANIDGCDIEYESLVDSTTNKTIVVCCTDGQAYPMLKLIIKKK